MVIRSSSSSLGYIWRAYSRNSGHSGGTVSATAGICPTTERTFSRGTPLYSANLRQELVLGISAPESQRLTVAWLIPKSEANWLGRRLRRRITSFKNETRGTSSVCTPAFYKLFHPDVNKDTLAFDLIKEVGPAGNFVAAKHARRFMRREHYHASLSDRNSREEWEAKGGEGYLAEGG